MFKTAVTRIRLLPVLIFFCTLTLTVRVHDIWQGVDGIVGGTVSLSSTEAQAQTAADPAQPMEAIPGLETPPDAALMADPALMVPEEDRATIAARMLTDDPTRMTQSEIDLLQRLAERREVLDARTREMDTREALLAAAESRIDRKIDEFKVLEGVINELIGQYDEAQAKKVQKLVAIYQNMKPKDAAAILDEMDMETLLLVVEKMKDRSLAPILAKMRVAKANEVTVELAKLKNLPRPGLEPQ